MENIHSNLTACAVTLAELGCSGNKCRRLCSLPPAASPKGMTPVPFVILLELSRDEGHRIGAGLGALGRQHRVLPLRHLDDLATQRKTN